MASHLELVQYQKRLSAQSEPLPFPLGPLGIPDMKFLDIPPEFSIDHLIGEEVKITDSRGKVQRVREGKTIKDIQKLTGAEILFLKGNQGRKPEKLEIRGSLNDVKLAEEFIRTFFKHPKPSQGSDGLTKFIVNGVQNPYFLSEIWEMLPSDSILRRKIMDFITNEMI